MNAPNPKPKRITAFETEYSDARFPDLGNAGWSRYSSAQPNSLAPHRHPGAFELCFIPSGAAFWWVGKNVYQVEPGEVFLCWPGELHGGEGQAMHACELYWVVFKLSEKTGSFGLSPAETKAIRHDFQTLENRKFRAPSQTETRFKQLLESLKSDAPLVQTRVQATLQLLLCDILEAANAQKVAPPDPRMQETINWLHGGHLAEASVEAMAAKAGLKPSYFRERFRKATGYRPVEYLNLLRIQAAKSKLLESGASITDIAYDLGFSSSQYFATVFRHATGQTPRAFRRLRS